MWELIKTAFWAILTMIIVGWIAYSSVEAFRAMQRFEHYKKKGVLTYE